MSPEAVREGVRVRHAVWGASRKPEDIAEIAVFLASDLSRFLTGESINASGGVLMD